MIELEPPMNNEIQDALEAWSSELRVGASVEQVVSSMAAAFSERLVRDISAYDPSTEDLDSILDEAQDDKRNPMLELGEEISVALNAMEADEILRAVETLPNFQEMVDEADGDDADLSMIAGDALVEVAMELVREIWADRREHLGAPATSPTS